MSAAVIEAAASMGEAQPSRLRKKGIHAAEIMDASEMISQTKTTATKTKRAARLEIGDTAR